MSDFREAAAEHVRQYWEVRRYLESVIEEGDRKLNQDEYRIDARDLLAMMTPEGE